MSTEYKYHESFPISKIDLSDQEFKARLDFGKEDEEAKELADSISREGQTDPVGLWHWDGKYWVIYGFTRVYAIHKYLKRNHIRANIYSNLTEVEARTLNIVNNDLHRALSEYEKALNMKKYKETGVQVFSQDPAKETICKMYRISKQHAFRCIQVAEYDCAELHKALRDERVTMGHSIEFTKYSKDIVRDLLADCIEQQWSVRELRMRLNAKRFNNKNQNNPPTQSSDKVEPTQKNTISRVEKTNLQAQADKVIELLKEVHISELNEYQKNQLSIGLQLCMRVLAG